MASTAIKKFKVRKKKDITILFIPNLLSKEGRIRKSFPYNRDWTIERYLKESNFVYKDMIVGINGKEEVKDLSKRLMSGDEISLSPNVGWGAVVAAASAIWTAALAHPYIAWGTILSVGYSVYSAITAPKLPTFNTSGDGLDESPTYAWDGVRTSSDPGTPIPVIYGQRAYGGKVINEYISTDGENSYLHTLLGVGWGELESITMRRINQNLAENYTDWTLTTRMGTLNQSVIPNFHDSHNLISVNVELLKDSAYTYTTTDDDIEALEVHFNFPYGLYQQSSDGNISSWSVTYKIEYKLHSDSEWIDLGSTTVSDKTRNEFKRIYRKDGLTAGQYDIRITKTSDDPSDLDYPITNGDLYIERIDEISCEDEQIFPRIGLAAVDNLAVEQLSGSFPNYELLVKGRKIMTPKVMNGEETVDWDDYYWDPDDEVYRLFEDDTELSWDGETFTTAYSANPIWCLYDLMTNTIFGAGHYITSDDNDLDFLIEQSQYCEEKVPDGNGGYEKRFRLDIVIDSQQKAFDLIVQLCSIFRAYPFYSDRGQVKIVIDKPEDSVQLFSPGNMIEKSFSETWGSLSEVPNMLSVQFDDEDSNYESQTVLAKVDDEALANNKPLNSKTIRYYGVKESYAKRFGRDYFNAAKHITNTSKFKSALCSIIRQCGEVIDIAHDVPQWGFGGSVPNYCNYRGDYDEATEYSIGDAVTKDDGKEYIKKEASAGGWGSMPWGSSPWGSSTWEEISRTLVKLDRTVEIEADKSYVVRVDFAKGGYEERIVTDSVGSYTELNVSVAFTKTPLPGDIYSFGETEKVVKPCRITRIKRNRDGTVEFEAPEYNESIYDDSAVPISTKKVSSLSTDFPQVRDLTLTERIVKLADGTIEDVIDVWFDKPNLASYRIGTYAKARIYLSDNDGDSWIYKGETAGTHFSISEDIKDLQTYKIAVVSVMANGTEDSIDSSPQEEITVQGKQAPPSDVTGFEVYQQNDTLYFSWNPVPDIDIARYEVRKGSEWNTATVVGEKVDSTELSVPVSEIGELTFLIKAFDTSENPSNTPGIDQITVVTPPNMNFVNTVDLFGQRMAYILNNCDLLMRNDYDSGYVRKVLALKTATTWEEREAEAQTWEYQEANSGLLLDRPVENSGYFQMVTPIDLEAIFSFKIVIDADYINVSGGSVTVQISYSEDGVTYSSFETIDADTYYRARYIKFKIILATTDTNFNVYLYGINLYITAPVTVLDYFQDVAIPLTGKTIPYGVEFSSIPKVTVTISNGVTGFIKCEKTIEDVTIRVFADQAQTTPIDTAEVDGDVKGY